MPKISPSFLLAAFMSGLMGYLAIVDKSLRLEFAALTSGAVTGFFSLSTAKKEEEKANWTGLPPSDRVDLNPPESDAESK